MSLVAKYQREGFGAAGRHYMKWRFPGQDASYAIAHRSDSQRIGQMRDWCAPFSGYHLHYPSRRQSSPAFNVLVDALRYRS